MASENSVRLFPTFSIINAQEQEFASWIGFRNGDTWIKNVNKVMADPITVTERLARFESSPTALDAALLGDQARAKGQWLQAGTYYKQVMELDAELARDRNVPFDYLRTVYVSYKTGDYSLDDLLTLMTGLLQDPKQNIETICTAGDYLLDLETDTDAKLIRSLLDKAYDIAGKSSDTEATRVKDNFIVAYMLNILNDADGALAHKRQTLPNGWKTDAHALNSFAWFCFEIQANLPEAEQLAAKAVSLAKDPVEKANNLDTQAQIAFIRGNKAVAVSLMKKAIELDPTSGYLKQQLVKFDQAAE